MLQIVPQLLVDSIILSCFYMLMSLGICYIFSILRVASFTHGEIYMLGGYVTWVCVTWMGMNYALSIVVAIVVVFLFGLALERLFWDPIVDKPLSCMIMSLGVLLVLQGGVAAIFGEREKGILTQVPGIISFGGVRLTSERFLVVGVAIGLVVALLFFLQNTKLGQAMRAVTNDPEVAALQGIPIRRMQMLGFGIGCGLAAAAGATIAPIYAIFPTMGTAPIFKAFVVIIIGGLGSVPGAIIASFILGFIDTFGLTLLGNVAHLLGFTVFILVLIIRPRGLMGYEA